MCPSRRERGSEKVQRRPGQPRHRLIAPRSKSHVRERSLLILPKEQRETGPERRECRRREWLERRVKSSDKPGRFLP